MGLVQLLRLRHDQRVAAEDRAAQERFMKDLPKLIQRISTQMTGAQPSQAQQQPKQPQGIPETPPVDLPEPSLTRPAQQPERFAQPDVQVIEEPTPVRQPPRFQKPMQVSGMSVNPKTRSITFSVKPDQRAMDAQFGTAFKDLLDKARAGGTAGLSEPEMRDNLFWNLVREFRFFPSDQLAKQLLPEWPERQEQAYFRLAGALERQESFRADIRKKAEELDLSEDAIERFIKFNAYLETSKQMNGYMPDDFREQFAAMQLPSVLPETAEVLGGITAFKGKEDIRAAREQLQEEAVTLAGRKKLRTTLAEHEAKAVLPVSREMAEAFRVPMGTTLDQVYEQQIQPLARDEKDIRKDAAGARVMIEKLATLSSLIHDDDSQIFFLTGIKRYGEKWARTNNDVVMYDRIKKGLLSKVARSLGEERGVLNNQDIMRVRQLLPGIIERAGTAKRNFEEIFSIIDEGLKRKLKAVTPPRAGTAQPPPEQTAAPQTGDWYIDEKGNRKRME